MTYVSTYFLETEANFTSRVAIEKVNSICTSTNMCGFHSTLLIP